MVIAIDGPGGAGKSTVSRRVAEKLNVPYLDTGATYRAATLAVLRVGVSPDDEKRVLSVVHQAAIGFEDGVVLLDGEDVTVEVRAPDVTASVSQVSANRGVRARIVALQRAWVADHGGKAVVEGRDIGTVVFPDATVKIFLVADHDVRTKRRSGDPEVADAGVDRVAADLAARDHADTTRETSPLTAAPDAVVVDTSRLTIEEAVAEVMKQVSHEP